MKKKNHHRFKKKGHPIVKPQHPGLDPSLTWYTEDEMRAMLGMCGKTLYRRREAGRIGYKKDGGKIYYSNLDYQRYMQSDHIDPAA